MHVARREIQLREAIRIDPDAHRNRLAAFAVGDFLHALDRGEARLHIASEVVRDGRDAPLLRVEAEIEGGVRPVGALHVDDGRLGFGRQLGAHLLEPRRHLRQGGCAVMVELQAHVDGALAGAARGFHVVDTGDGRYRALDRSRDEAANGFGARPVIQRRNDDRGAFELWILLDG